MANNGNQFHRGRGALSNVSGRFEKISVEWDPIDPSESPSPQTQFFRDHPREILSENKSPDLGFRYGLNPYRGCEHGCAYCYARPTHEYLGYSAGLDFETKIFFKENAPELLTQKLLSPSWKPELIMMSGITDCYQPAERRFQLTRRCLEVFARFRNPVGLITKNHLVTRDVDILCDLAADGLVLVFLSVTTLDGDLGRQLEPRTSTPDARLRAIETLAQAGIPVGVNIAPVIPGLNDHEIPAILQSCRQAGAEFSGLTPLRLPFSVRQIFEQWLLEHLPERQTKILNQIREIRGGKLNDSEFGSRMRGRGPRAESIHGLYEVFRQRLGFNEKVFCPRTDLFRRSGDQLRFF